MADDTKPVESADSGVLPKRTSTPAPKVTRDPLDKWLDTFLASYDPETFKAHLKNELVIRGIGPDVQAHQLRDLSDALRAALRADAHALYDAAQK